MPQEAAAVPARDMIIRAFDERSTPPGPLECLNGRTFQVEDVDFVKEYFPDCVKSLPSKREVVPAESR